MANTSRRAGPGPHDTAEFEITLADWHEDGKSGKNHYYHACAMPQHKRYSVEELRLNDYNNGKGIVRTRSTRPKGFVEAHESWLHASLPDELPNHQQRGPCIRQMAIANPCDLTPNIIDFHIGTPEKDGQFFAIHECMIAPRSEFVRLALSRDWKEAQEKVIKLPEDSPDAFQLYQSWMYANRIYSEQWSGPGYINMKNEYRMLVDSYILGEKLIDGHFQDAIIDSIIDALRTIRRFDTRLSNRIYQNTPDKSPLRTLLQDIYIWCGSTLWLEEENVGEPVNAEFALDLSKRQLAFWGGQRPEQAPFLVDTCAYHQHAEGLCHKMSMR